MFGLRRYAATARSASGVGGPAPGVLGGGFGGPASTSFTRFNPVFDDLSRGDISEDMVPRDQRGQNRLWRLIYLRDLVGGPGVDVFKEIAYSDFTITGVTDPAKLRIYEDAKDAVKLHSWCPEIAGERLVMGRAIVHMLFDESKGHWTDLIVHNPDFIDIDPIMMAGSEAKIDLIPSPDMKRFMLSKDPRDVRARARLAPETIRLVLSGQKIPLNPDNTAFLRRKGAPDDPFGVSLYSRMIGMLAIEKALRNGTVQAVRRFIGPRYHVEAGLENPLWDPTPSQLEELVEMFTRAEEDPVGAVVATRFGVKVSELGGGKQQIWALDDSWEMIQQGKMWAIGISPAFLTGEATYNNMEHATSLLIDRLRGDRGYLKDQFIVGKFYKVLAQAHGFYKRTEAELSHRIRTTPPTEDQLDLPDIDWHKQLKPESDLVYLDVLKVMKEEGVPVPVRIWAAAGGVDFDKVMLMLDGDLEERRKIMSWRSQVDLVAPGEPTGAQDFGDEGGDEEPPEMKDIPTIHSRLDKLPVWRAGQVLGVSRTEVGAVAEVVARSSARNGNRLELANKAMAEKGMPPAKRELVRYLLGRARVVPPTRISQETLKDLCSWVTNGGVHITPAAARELQFAAVLAEEQAPVLSKDTVRQLMSHQENGLADNRLLVGF